MKSLAGPAAFSQKHFPKHSGLGRSGVERRCANSVLLFRLSVPAVPTGKQPYSNDYRDKVITIDCQQYAELSLLTLYFSHGLLNYLHSLTLESLIAVRPINTLTSRSFISLFASVTFNHKQTISTVSCVLQLDPRAGRGRTKRSSKSSGHC